MANLNLSQFGENTSVSDADYTFVWDSAASISKKVSRNSWLNSGELTSSAPVTISQTWGTTGTYTAAKVNVTETATANAASLLLDLQLGSVSRVKVNKEGNLVIAAVSGAMIQCTASSQGVLSSASAFPKIWGARFDFQTAAGGTTMLGIGPTQVEIPTQLVFNTDTILLRDSASGNTLALRNGGAAQTFRVYNTYTDASNYERAVFGYGSNQINLGSDVAGSGVHRKLNILGAGIDFYHAGIGIRWSINTSGHFIAAADNTYDIGASGAGRPRNIYAGSNIYAAGNVGIGTTAPAARLHISTDNSADSFICDRYVESLGVAAPAFILRKARGTFTSPTAVQSGDILGVFGTRGYGATAFSAGSRAFFGGYASENWTDSAQGAYLSLFTTPTGSITAAVAMTILGSGNVGIGTTSPTSKLHVAETWNNAGTAFCAIKSVITDTNSAVGSDFLELYSGTSTQPLRMDINKTGQINIYGAWTDASNYERLSFNAPSAANAVIGTNKAGTGTARGLEFQTDGVTRMTIAATASAVTFTNGISAGSGSNSIFNFTSSVAMYLTAGGYGASATVALFSPSDGVLRLTNGATTDFNRLQFGGTTNAFPAVARDGAGIKFTGAAAGSTAWIKVPPVAVSALPLAATAGVGARAFVDDASSPTFGSAVTGGGSIPVPVYSTGSAWNVG